MKNYMKNMRLRKLVTKKNRVGANLHYLLMCNISINSMKILKSKKALEMIKNMILNLYNKKNKKKLN
jgi:hypothetical protein